MILPEKIKTEIAEYNDYPVNFKEVTKEEWENFLIHECIIPIASKQILKKKSKHQKYRGYLSCSLFALEFGYTKYPIGYGLAVDFDKKSIYFRFGNQDEWDNFNKERSEQMKD